MFDNKLFKNNQLMERSKLIYLLNFITNALINFDHGIIPACTTDLKRDL